MVAIQLRQLDVPPGQRLLLHDVSWAEFEAILEELGEHRGTRIAYDNGLLEIMAPLPEHESDKEIIGDLLKALLEELDTQLESHELLKLRLRVDERDTRDAVIEQLVESSGAELVSRVGNVAILYRARQQAPRLSLPR